MGLKPVYRIAANGRDITSTLDPRLERLTITDRSGVKSDTLDLVLADNDPLRPIVLPETGAELEAWIGYDGQALKYGLYIVDEVALSGPVSRVSIRAHAAPQTTSKSGRESMQTQKSRSWPKDTLLGDMLKTIAGEHGLDPKVSDELASVVLPHTDQVNESDMNLLTRLARKYDGLVKPAGGNLVLVKRGQGLSATGEPLPNITLTPASLSNWEMKIAKRVTAATVVAIYRDIQTGEDVEVSVGEGSPTYRLRNPYKDEAEAKQAAQADLDRRKRSGQLFSASMPGRSDLMAEGKVTLQAFRRDMNTQWTVTSATHEMTKGGGYVCKWEGEIP